MPLIFFLSHDYSLFHPSPSPSTDRNPRSQTHQQPSQLLAPPAIQDLPNPGQDTAQQAPLQLGKLLELP